MGLSHAPFDLTVKSLEMWLLTPLRHQNSQHRSDVEPERTNAEKEILISEDQQWRWSTLWTDELCNGTPSVSASASHWSTIPAGGEATRVATISSVTGGSGLRSRHENRMNASF